MAKKRPLRLLILRQTLSNPLHCTLDFRAVLLSIECPTAPALEDKTGSYYKGYGFLFNGFWCKHMLLNKPTEREQLSLSNRDGLHFLYSF